MWRRLKIRIRAGIVILGIDDWEENLDVLRYRAVPDDRLPVERTARTSQEPDWSRLVYGAVGAGWIQYRVLRERYSQDPLPPFHAHFSIRGRVRIRARRDDARVSCLLCHGKLWGICCRRGHGE